MNGRDQRECEGCPAGCEACMTPAQPLEISAADCSHDINTGQRAKWNHDGWLPTPWHAPEGRDFLGEQRRNVSEGEHHDQSHGSRVKSGIVPAITSNTASTESSMESFAMKRRRPSMGTASSTAR